jgi:hypothetical protein
MGGEKEPMDEGVFYYSTDGAIDLLDSLYEHLDITREKEAN